MRISDCSSDVCSSDLLPEPGGIARCARGRVTVGIALSEWHPAQFAQDIFAVTAGTACAENAAITLADRKTGRAIGMRAAQTHGGAAMPGTAESTYAIDASLGWPSACTRHGILLLTPPCPPPPSPRTTSLPAHSAPPPSNP